jgi:hypothetical protein
VLSPTKELDVLPLGAKLMDFVVVKCGEFGDEIIDLRRQCRVLEVQVLHFRLTQRHGVGSSVQLPLQIPQFSAESFVLRPDALRVVLCQ